MKTVLLLMYFAYEVDQTKMYFSNFRVKNLRPKTPSAIILLNLTNTRKLAALIKYTW